MSGGENMSVFRAKLPDERVPEDRVCGLEQWLRRSAVDHFLRAAASPRRELISVIQRRARIGETEVHSGFCC